MNPRFEALVRAVGGSSQAFPPLRIEEEKSLPPYLPIKYAILRQRLSKQEARAKGKMDIDGIDVQRARNTAYVQRHGWEIIGDYTDADLSGEVFEEGERFQAMMRFIRKLPEEKRRATVIVFKAPDRMGREVRKMLNVLYELQGE